MRTALKIGALYVAGGAIVASIQAFRGRGFDPGTLVFWPRTVVQLVQGKA